MKWQTVLLAIALAALPAMALELPPGVQVLIQYESHLAASVNLVIAFLAGVLSFTSPCGLALVPAYLSFGLQRKRSFVLTSAFSLGLLAALLLFGIVAGIVGGFFNPYKLRFAALSGVALIIFGVLLLLNRGWSLFSSRIRAPDEKSILGTASLGFFFGVGWTPCMGPVLSGIILLASSAGNITGSALLMSAFALGVALPLLLLSVLADKTDVMRFLRGRPFSFTAFGKRIETHTYNIIGGLLLIALGLIMVSYQGTFFFQTTFVKYIPWSMSFWSEMNEMLITSPVFRSPLLRALGGIVIMGILAVIAFSLKAALRGNGKEANPDGQH